MLRSVSSAENCEQESDLKGGLNALRSERVMVDSPDLSLEDTRKP